MSNGHAEFKRFALGCVIALRDDLVFIVLVFVIFDLKTVGVEDNSVVQKLDVNAALKMRVQFKRCGERAVFVGSHSEALLCGARVSDYAECEHSVGTVGKARHRDVSPYVHLIRWLIEISVEVNVCVRVGRRIVDLCSDENGGVAADDKEIAAVSLCAAYRQYSVAVGRIFRRTEFNGHFIDRGLSVLDRPHEDIFPGHRGVHRDRVYLHRPLEHGKASAVHACRVVSGTGIFIESYRADARCDIVGFGESDLAEILGTDVACAGDILFEIVRIGKALKLYGRDLSAEVFGDAVADLYRVVWAVCVYSVRTEKLRINTAIHLVFVS